MTRIKFTEQLSDLNNEMIQMGSLCESAIDICVDALLNGDVALAKVVSQREREIDEKESEITALCMKMLLHQQPVASDLRQISAALKMVTDLERIGDQADDIGEMIEYTAHHQHGEYSLIQKMGLATKKMVRDSIDAFVKQDEALACEVIKYDDVVDDLFIQLKKVVIEAINNKEIDGEYASDLLMIAKYFERIGDHAVNVAEWVEYSITGGHRRDEQE